jgi:hypothetical protein
MIHAGMKVLFIAPKFFGYEQEIKRELELLGCDVDWFDDRPSSTPIVKALIRFKPELIASYSDAYFDQIIKRTKDTSYDAIFIIKGEAISKARLDALKAQQTKARFLYYTWDSLKNFKNGLEKLHSFDKVFSFDSDDCITYPFVQHLPLFYIKAYENVGTLAVTHSEEPSIDFLFLGSIHSDRYSVIQKIWSAAHQTQPNIKLYDHFFYQSKWVFTLRNFFDPQFRNIPWDAVKWNSLNKDETLALIANSRIIVDVHHPGQKGLTMRTVESLGAQKKLITTNESIKDYDFFLPENILIVDRHLPIIPLEFLKSPFKTLPPDIYRKYSLTSWLQEIFS